MGSSLGPRQIDGAGLEGVWGAGLKIEATLNNDQTPSRGGGWLATNAVPL